MILHSCVHLVVVFLLCCCVCVWKELLLKDEECERLSKVRDQLGQELEELTASLFQVGLPPHPCVSASSASCFLFPLPPEAAARQKKNNLNLNN